MATLELGAKFASYMEAENAIKNYEETKYVQLWKKWSRTISSARKRGTVRPIKEELVYSEITYACIHAGTYKSRSTGVRPKQETYRHNCPAMIRMNVGPDGETLQITKLIEHHNHELNKNAFACLPRQRTLDEPTKQLAKKMLALRVNKKLLQTDIITTTNKCVKLKDLHNLNCTRNSEDPLPKVISLLQDKNGATVELLKDSENCLKGIYYQDEEMKRTFSAYPEIIFVDAIYKISDRRMPLYIILVENSNGEGEIVAFFLLTSEDASILKSTASIFKKNNPAWINTQCIMSDKDFIERQAFGSEFPTAKLLICLFHSLRSFKREVSTEKMKITSGERDFCLTCIEKMAYASNEQEYMAFYDDLKKSGIKNVIDYLEENWHHIREQWVVGLQQKQGMTCGNRTNNRLESINQKVVQVVGRHSTLDSLFEGLIQLLISLRTERECSASKSLLKIPLNVNVSCAAEAEYMKTLTSYAFEKVSAMLHKKDSVTILEKLDDDSALVKTKGGNIVVKTDTCQCAFFVSMHLPCHHVLKVREICGLDLFSFSIFSPRWTKSFYLKNSRLALENQIVSADAVNNIHCTVIQPKKVMSQHEKFRQAFSISQKLASLASESSRHYSSRVELLEKLVKFWGNNEEAAIYSIDSNRSPLQNSQGANGQQTEFIHLNLTSVDPYADTSEAVTETQQPEISLLHSEETNSDNTVQVDIAETNDGSRMQKQMRETENNEEAVIIVDGNNISSLRNLKASSSQQSEDLHFNFTSANPCVDTSGVLTEIIHNSKENLPNLPPKFKKRGRPKGNDKTVIGLPAKKGKRKLTTFEKRSTNEQVFTMLKWFVSSVDAKAALKGKLLGEDAIEQNPNLISSACLENCVCIDKLRKFFDSEGWIALKHVVDMKRKSPIWLCSTCMMDADGNTSSIFCNGCLEWFHLQCQGLKKVPKKKFWFCQSCRTSNVE